MQCKQPNSIKQFIFRAMAVTITLCYILGPAHMQLNSVLHSISHNLKAPGYVLQHDGLTYEDYENQASLKEVIVGNSLNHEHQLLNLIDEIFDTQPQGNENQKGESTSIDFKINKHITSRKANIVFQGIIIKDVSEFWVTTVTCKPGYLLQLYRPPEV